MRTMLRTALALLLAASAPALEDHGDCLYNDAELATVIAAVKKSLATGATTDAVEMLAKLGVPERARRELADPMAVFDTDGKPSTPRKPDVVIEARPEVQTTSWVKAHPPAIPVALVAADGGAVRLVSVVAKPQGDLWWVGISSKEPEALEESLRFEVSAVRAESAKLPLLVEMGDPRLATPLQAERFWAAAQKCASFAALPRERISARVYEDPRMHDTQDRVACPRYAKFVAEVDRLMPKNKLSVPVEGLVLFDPKRGDVRVLHYDTFLTDRDWKALIGGAKPASFADAAPALRTANTFLCDLNFKSIHLLDVVAADQRDAMKRELKDEGIQLQDADVARMFGGANVDKGEGSVVEFKGDSRDSGAIVHGQVVVGRGEDAIVYTCVDQLEQTVLTLKKRANAWWVVKRETWKAPAKK